MAGMMQRKETDFLFFCIFAFVVYKVRHKLMHKVHKS